MYKQLKKLIPIIISLFLFACVASVDASLPYQQLPTVAVATEVKLVASPAHPTSYLPSATLAAGEKVQVIGADEDLRWLLVLHDNLLGWMPTFFAGTNTGRLKPAIVIEPLTDNCTDYLDTVVAPDEAWISNTDGALTVIGSIYRPQTGKQFDNASLAIQIDGSGTVIDADYVHTLLTPTSAVILFAYSVVNLQESDQVRFEVSNPSNEPLSFQAAFFSNGCIGSLGQLNIGKLKVVKDGQVASPKADKVVATELSATPTPVSILIEGGLRQVFTLDLSNYELGDIADEFGMDLLVKEENDDRYLSGLNDYGRIELRNLDLQGNFEVTFIVDFNDSDSVVSLQSDSGDEINIIFDDDIIFGNTSNNYNEPWKGGSSLNRCRLLVNGDTAKFYINDIFFGTVVVETGITYTRFIISNISQNEKVQYVAATELPGEDVATVKDDALTSDKTGFAVNFNVYEVGDVPEELGTDLLIQSADNKRYIAGLSNEGQIELRNLDLQGNFEVTFIVDFNDSDSVVSLQSDSGDEINIIFDDDIIFGNTSNNYNEPWKGGSSLNRCRLLVNGDTAKFYINDIFFGTVVVETGITYTRFIISNISQNEKVQYLQGKNL